MINVTFSEPISDACVQWCALQHVAYHNNINAYSVILVAISYVLLVSVTFVEPYDPNLKIVPVLFHLSKIFMLLFFAYFFLVVVYGVI